MIGSEYLKKNRRGLVASEIQAESQTSSFTGQKQEKTQLRRPLWGQSKPQTILL